jgi:hypothetical protein
MNDEIRRRSEEERIKLLAAILGISASRPLQLASSRQLFAFFTEPLLLTPTAGGSMIGVVWLLAGLILYFLAWTVLGRLK